MARPRRATEYDVEAARLVSLMQLTEDSVMDSET